MLEQESTYTVENVGSGETASDATLVMEKVIDAEHVNINHIVVPPGGAVPTHVSNSWIHQIIVRGVLTMELEDEPVQYHSAGTIVAVPFNTRMAIRNEGPVVLEFFVVKAPNPRVMPATKEI